MVRIYTKMQCITSVLEISACTSIGVQSVNHRDVSSPASKEVFLTRVVGNAVAEDEHIIQWNTDPTGIKKTGVSLELEVGIQKWYCPNCCGFWTTKDNPGGAEDKGSHELSAIIVVTALGNYFLV